eukprot:TRINITY_DN2279_c0_g1_i1.p1 TRINITY_DN2279_c0_g1~~TRINITY_DN2279_c0_g1_i1.p1  ORF type:complete len:103 (-),score=16.83 TRINITY_DN2279_c0_g1_i1:121-408(-)
MTEAQLSWPTPRQEACAMPNDLSSKDFWACNGYGEDAFVSYYFPVLPEVPMVPGPIEKPDLSNCAKQLNGLQSIALPPDGSLPLLFNIGTKYPAL